MQRIYLIITVIVTLSVLLGCKIDLEKNLRLKEEFFFSTDQFFSSEAVRLSKQRGMIKYVLFNGKEEVMKLDTLNFDHEFTPFKKCDINKVIWSDQYACDTVYTNNNEQVASIKCKALNSKLVTRKLDVGFKNGQVESIDIECMMQKMLLETMEYMSYKKDLFYEIKRVQTLKTGTIDSTLVKVTF